MEVVIVGVVLTSLWVLVDSIQIGARRGLLGGGMLDIGPAGWFFCCLVLWVIGFPAYLITRSKIKEAGSREKAGQSQPASTSVTEELQQMAVLKNQGVLTEDEFAAKKRQLLGLGGKG